MPIKCVSRPRTPSVTFPGHQKSSLRTRCLHHALLAGARDSASSHRTSFYRFCRNRSACCPRLLSGDTLALCLQMWRLGNRQFHPYRLPTYLPCSFYVSVFVFAKGRLLMRQVVELCLMQPACLALDPARAEPPLAALSQVS